MDRRKLLSRGVVPLIILVVGIIGFVTLVRTKPKAEKNPIEERAALVEVLEVQARRHATWIEAQGTVVPASQVALSPQVSGRVVWKSPDLVAGARVSKGAPLMRIDPRDFELAVNQARAQVRRAEVELEVERGRGLVAEKELALTRDRAAVTGATNPLVLREPQLRAAEAALEGARSALAQAQLALERTTVTAPMNALVQSESVDVGQIVGPSVRVAALVGTDIFRVQASIPLDKVASIRLPSDGEQGARAEVILNAGADRGVWNGEAVRLLGDLEQAGRMARLLINIPQPLDGSNPLPLFLGAFVNVRIEGKALEDVIEIPRVALREGDEVYVMTPDSRLEIRPVEVAWRRADSVLVRSGLAAGERIVTSRIATPLQGMALREIPPESEGKQGS